MPRPRQRVRLESGLKLDLNRLVKKGLIQPGACKASGISWTGAYSGEIAVGIITADMSGLEGPYGWFRIQIGSLDRTHPACGSPPPFRWLAVKVFYLPLQEPTRVGAVEATEGGP